MWNQGNSEKRPKGTAQVFPGRRQKETDKKATCETLFDGTKN